MRYMSDALAEKVSKEDGSYDWKLNSVVKLYQWQWASVVSELVFTYVPQNHII